MLIRIVRMQFTDAGESEFLELFGRHQKTIRHFPGCTHLELLKEADRPRSYATLSHWKNPRDLEAYRQSALFESVWGKVRPLFAEKTQAFSLEKYIEVDA
jgi:heme-degrading monooxygenase HmoA